MTWTGGTGGVGGDGGARGAGAAGEVGAGDQVGEVGEFREVGGIGEVDGGGRRGRRLSPRSQLTLAAAVAAFVAMLAVLGAVLAGYPRSAGPQAITDVGGRPVAVTGTAAPATTTSTGGPTTTSPTSTTGAPAATSAPTTSAAGGFGSIRDVDLRTFVYPGPVCPDVRGGDDGTLTFHDGVAGVSEATIVLDDPTTYGYGADIDSIGYGDVTGDGVEDAFVHVRCAYLPGERYDDALVVVTASTSGTMVAGVLDEAAVTHRVTDVYGSRDVTYDVVEAARADGGALVIDWLDVHFGARFATTVRYAYDGAFVPVGDSGLTDRLPGLGGPPPAPPIGPVASSILRHDLHTLAVPLSGARVCGRSFAELGPLADARFDPEHTTYDGVTHISYADVMTADGRPTDARVVLGGATYLELTAIDGVAEVEAVVSIGCQRGDVTTWGLMVLRDTPGDPELIGAVFGPGPFEGAVDAQVASSGDLDSGDLPIEWTDGEHQVIAASWLRWDGTTFVEVPVGYCHL